MKFVDRFKQSFNGTNTSVITLGGAVSGFRTGAQAIADGDMVVGDEVPMGVREGATWELSLFKVDSPTQLSRVRVLASWIGGTAATFPAGTHEIACTTPADFLNGIDLASVSPLTTIVDAVRLFGLDTAGELRTVTATVLKAYMGGTATPADTTVPGAPTNLASNSVTQTTFNVTFTAGTDNVGVARSEWSLDGTTWTAIGSATSFSVSGRTAATTYTVRVRTVDTSGNPSAAATINVTTMAASTPDTQAPTWLAGSLTTSDISSSGYVMNFPGATDNVGVDHLESSIDGGATWVSHPAGTTSRTVTGRPASTTDQLRLRALDAAGNISNVLTATVTTSAAAPTAPTLTKYGAVRAQGASTGQANVTTNVATGELRILLSANASEDVAVVVASTTTQAVTAAGVQKISLTGIVGTTLHMHVVHRANGVDSAVVSTPLYQYAPRSGAAPKASILPSTGSVNGSDVYYVGSDYFTGTYYDITPTPSAVVGGWGDSATEPPPIRTLQENNAVGKLNGMAPLSPAASPAWTMTSPYLWAANDSTRKGPKFYYAQIGDAPAVRLSDSAGSYIEATG